MKRQSSHRIAVVWLAVVAGIWACAGAAKADFTFGEPTDLGPTINGPYETGSPCISLAPGRLGLGWQPQDALCG